MTLEQSPSTPRNINPDTALFWRWLALNGRAGRIPEGKPEGDLVLSITSFRGRSVIDKLIIPRTIRDQIAKDGDY